jgi:hypothetical protein
MWMMDIFINTIDPDRFRATNNAWNLLGLNSPQNVGMVSELITRKSFSSKEEWEAYYYEHGRSKDYLAEVGKRLFSHISSQMDITLDECVECVRFRVICETWNGIALREPNTINTLNIATDERFEFRKTTGDNDFEYAIDYEMYFDNSLICGIQIKPTSYNTSNADYILRARFINRKKNEKYEQKFDVPVFTITSDSNGGITSGKEFANLMNLSNKF